MLVTVKGIRILVADDHEILRRGMRTLLETREGWEICGEACHGEEAVQKTKELCPDLVILDLSMPGMSGLEAARQILQHCPTTLVLIFTMHASQEVVREVLKAGVRGYILKSDGARDLIAAVEALLQNKTFITSSVADYLA